jgi:hypothetical protein
MGLLAFSIGMWLGVIIMFLMVVRPLQTKYDNLRDAYKQQIKIGFYNEELLKQDDYE